MPRKSTAAIAANDAPIEPSHPVTERKRARRAHVAPPAAPSKPAIDLTKPNARRVLEATWPHHVPEKVVEASDADARAALEYWNARDAAQIAEGRKEAAGNVLRYAIGDAEELRGDGWKATWKTQKSTIDWGALAKELNIPSDVIERFRRPDVRVLNVRETVEGDEC